jgi:hypothetical protein
MDQADSQRRLPRTRLDTTPARCHGQGEDEDLAQLPRSYWPNRAAIRVGTRLRLPRQSGRIIRQRSEYPR